MAQGLDNFLYDLQIDGATANFHFYDADDPKNVADVSISPKEYPEGVTTADSREVADYAYSLVAEKMNAARSDRAKALAVDQADKDAEAAKTERAVTAAGLKISEDVTTKPTTTETREDGVKQNVYSSTVDSSAPSKKK
jgi:hypothetical protein